MKLQIKKGKSNTYYYIVDSFRNSAGVSTSRIFQKLGTHKELQAKLGEGADVEQWCRERLEEINLDLEANKPVPVSLTIQPDVPVSEDEWDKKMLFNVGSVILKQEFFALGLDALFKQIKAKEKIGLDLNAIISDMVCARIMAPHSKISTYDYADKHFLLSPQYARQDGDLALRLIAEYASQIRDCCYKALKKLPQRDTKVLYYDGQVFGFWEADCKCTPYRYGVYMDGSGIPQGYIVYPGDGEQPGLQDFEQRIVDDFIGQGAKLVISDHKSRRSGTERRFSGVENREFFAVEPLSSMPDDKDGTYDGFCDVPVGRSRKLEGNPVLMPIRRRYFETYELFDDMKPDFGTEADSVSRDEQVNAHFCISYLALLVFRLFEQKLWVKDGKNYSAGKIIRTLRKLNILRIGQLHTCAFQPSELTNRIQDAANLGVYVDCQFISAKSFHTLEKKSQK